VIQQLWSVLCGLHTRGLGRELWARVWKPSKRWTLCVTITPGRHPTRASVLSSPFTLPPSALTSCAPHPLRQPLHIPEPAADTMCAAANHKHSHVTKQRLNGAGPQTAARALECGAGVSRQPNRVGLLLCVMIRIHSQCCMLTRWCCWWWYTREQKLWLHYCTYGMHPGACAAASQLCSMHMMLYMTLAVCVC
jgi:hypothetical protein